MKKKADEKSQSMNARVLEDLEPSFKLVDEERGEVEVLLPKEAANELKEMLKIKRFLNIHPDICPNCHVSYGFSETNNTCPRCGLRYVKTSIDPFPESFGKLLAIWEQDDGYFFRSIGKIKRVRRKTEQLYLVRKEYYISNKRQPKLHPPKNINYERAIKLAFVKMYNKVSEVPKQESSKNKTRSKPFLV